MHNKFMPLQFECPACGGMIDYPEIDEYIEEYDLNVKDPYYFEDFFGDDLTVTYDWCKKRVEIPLVIPQEIPADPLKEFDDLESARDNSHSFHLLLNTLFGKIVLGVLLLIYFLTYSPEPW